MSKKQFKSKKKIKEIQEFQEEVLDIARVTRVVKGGRRLRFRATVIVGNRSGKVGIGTGKSVEVATAIQKAVSKAKKALIIVPLTKFDSIPHEVKMKYKSAKLMIMPAHEGTGIIAGGAVRKIADLAGIKNMYGKSFGTTNKLVGAQATMRALQKLREVRQADRKINESNVEKISESKNIKQTKDISKKEVSGEVVSVVKKEENK